MARAERQAYDHVHGAGAYDAKVHAKTVELQKIFKTLTNKRGNRNENEVQH